MREGKMKRASSTCSGASWACSSWSPYSVSSNCSTTPSVSTSAIQISRGQITSRCQEVSSGGIKLLFRSKCWGEDSNLHLLRDQVLSLARLPISPPQHFEKDAFSWPSHESADSPISPPAQLAYPNRFFVVTNIFAAAAAKIF